MANSRKIWTPILILLIVLVLIVFAYNKLDIAARMTISGAVSDVMEGQRFDKAREELENLDRRKLVIESLKSALDDDTDNVLGKWRVLQILSDFGETRVMARALDSEVASTRRAAARFYEHQQRYRDRVTEIALDWLRDENAASRDLAVRLVQSIGATDALPDLEKMLAETALTDTDVRAQMSALGALATLGGGGAGERSLRIAADQKAHPHLRNAALNVLGRVETVPLDETRDLAVRILNDRQESQILRTGATNVLMRKDLGQAAVWDALKAVVVNDSETDRIVQRSAFNALSTTCPLDDLRGFITTREVYAHPYPWIRGDVAAALAILNHRVPLTLDILETYLTNESTEDSRHEVRREAWLSFYQLTGVAHGVRQTAQFPRRPAKPITREAEIRAKLWNKGWMRPGISTEQFEAVEAIVGDLAQMKEIRQTYASARNAILEGWAEKN